jgi:hypothetical protein
VGIVLRNILTVDARNNVLSMLGISSVKGTWLMELDDYEPVHEPFAVPVPEISRSHSNPGRGRARRKLFFA